MTHSREIIREAENRMKQRLPRVDKIECMTFGYVIDKDGNITGLGLYDYWVTAAPFLGELTNLTDLNLAGNIISDWGFLSELTGLTRLWLDYCGIEGAGFLGGLTNLTDLSLSGNKLSNWSFLSNLTGLRTLDLTGCGIEDAGFLGQLTNLTELNLSDNKIRDWGFLSKLAGLKDLALYDCGIEDAGIIGGLDNLELVYLHGNRIKRIDRRLVETGMEINWNRPVKEAEASGIYIGDNPIEEPPLEIVKEGTEAIRNYFKALEETKEELKLYEAKLLIVGWGEVGKTWLTSRIITGELPKKEGTTRGIDIHKWAIEAGGIKDFRVNFWDFGGQQILHSTHQFFLSRRSLYIFVWAARGDDDLVSFDYWLNVIRLLSDNSPVLVVMNKSDERIKNIEETALRKEFTNIIDFYRASAKENKGIAELRERVKLEIAKLPQVGTTLPRAWVDVRRKLEGMKRPYIQYTEYVKICNEHGLDEKQARFLSDYYHDLGVILNFKDKPELATVVFLDSQWATEAVYKIVETLETQQRDGRFRFGQLKDMWDSAVYPEKIHSKLIELMKKFELCFELDGRGEYIVPELLKADKPPFEWDGHDNMRFEYHYDFMPAGVISRFIARVHELHKERLYWKNGVVLEWEGHTQAMVVSEPLAKKIRIYIRGEDKKGLMGIVREHIEHIHRTLNEPRVKKMLPCICPECRNSTERHSFEYETLLTAKRKGRTEKECDHSCKPVNIDALLGEYGMEDDLRREMYPEARIYRPEPPEPKPEPEPVPRPRPAVDAGLLVRIVICVSILIGVIGGVLLLLNKYVESGWNLLLIGIVLFVLVVPVLVIAGAFAGAFGEKTVRDVIRDCASVLKRGLDAMRDCASVLRRGQKASKGKE